MSHCHVALVPNIASIASGSGHDLSGMGRILMGKCSLLLSVARYSQLQEEQGQHLYHLCCRATHTFRGSRLAGGTPEHPMPRSY